jgi:hypothetical protein
LVGNGEFDVVSRAIIDIGSEQSMVFFPITSFFIDKVQARVFVLQSWGTEKWFRLGRRRQGCGERHELWDSRWNAHGTGYIA